MTATIWLIARHGNNFAPGDKPRLVGGRTDLPLSASGIMQAQRLGAYLRAQGLLPDHIYVSGLRRTQETAHHALAAAGCAAPVTMRAFLNEIDYGLDENKSEDEASARIGAAALRAWQEAGAVPEGWLADPQAIRAGWRAFGAEILQTHAGKIILTVASNGIIRFLPYPGGDDAIKPKMPTGALAIVMHDGTSWQIKDWNIRP